MGVVIECADEETILEFLGIIIDNIRVLLMDPDWDVRLNISGYLP